MVDVMAPVSGNIEEERSRMWIPRARDGQQSPREAPTRAESQRRRDAQRRRTARIARGRDRRDEDESEDSASDSEDENQNNHRGGKHNQSSLASTHALPTSTAIRTVPAVAQTPPTSTLVLTTSVPLVTPTPVLTPRPSSLSPVSTLAPLPTVSNPGVVVANPQQLSSVLPSIVSSSAALLSADLPAFTLSSNPRKGEDSGTTTSSTLLLTPVPTSTILSSPAAALDTFPSPTIFIDDNDNNDGNNRDHDDHHNGPPSGLSPTAEDVLISAGSIGAFILICFVVWISWRTLKKSQKPNRSNQDADFSSPNNLLAKIPYFGRNQRGWQDLDGSGVDMRDPPPMYDTKSLYSQSSTYSSNNPRHVSDTMSSRGMPVLPELQTNFTYSVTGQPFSGSTMNGLIQPTSAQSMRSLASMQNALRVSQAQQQQQQAMQLPQLQMNFSPSTMGSNPFISPQDVSNASTFRPQVVAQYSTGSIGTGTMGNGTMETYESLSSDRSRMADAYYNQSELARQASAAYDPAKRAVYRASELSSISSGFGDGDFIIPPPPAAALQPQGGEPRPMSYAKSTARSRSNSTVNGNGQRDTVYTTTSEDLPARYRSVNSWVNQQTGRVQRQQARDNDADVPPVPSLPAEDRYTMMMDDGEVPRRYEDTLTSQPPVPAIPAQNENNPTNRK